MDKSQQAAWDEGLRKFLVDHFYWLASFLFLSACFVGGGLSYSYFSQQVQYNQETLKRLQDDVQSSKTYSILTEKRLSTIAEALDRKNDKETADMMRTLIKELEKVRSK